VRRGFGAPSVLATALIAAFVAGACGPQPASPAEGAAQPSTAFLARHKPMNGGPAAIVSGTLVERDGCLLLEVAGGTTLALWPPDASAWVIDGVTTIVDGKGRPAVAVGGPASFGGGYDYPLDWAETQAGPIPERCRTGTYILVNDLEWIPQD
jgi:hypothetical protein